MPIHKRELGKTGIKMSEVGYGAAALFGKDVLGKQGITDEEACNIIYTAIDSGVNFFDTAINYGYAEERLGRCLSEVIRGGHAKRADLVVATKCGEMVNADGTYGACDWSSDWIKRSLEISLKRLQTDYVDLFAMHGGLIKDCSDELLNTFRDMKSQGVIRAYGINTFDTGVLEWIVKEKNFDYVMMDYNILRQDRESLIADFSNAGIGVIAGSSLGESLYSKNVFKVRNRNDFWYLARAIFRFKSLMKKSKKFDFLMKQEGYTANQLALRYVLDNEQISSACFSTINVEHLKENLKATDITMPGEIKEEIKKRV